MSPRLRVIQLVAASLGAVAILLTPAGVFWKLCAGLALVLVTAMVHAASMKKSHSGWIELLRDGTAHITFRDGKRSLARLGDNAWAIRWFCVVALFEPESGRHYHCVVCASQNAPNDYRRLLKYLNMRAPAEHLQKATWW